jgi:dienelactone hydrolase
VGFDLGNALGLAFGDAASFSIEGDGEKRTRAVIVLPAAKTEEALQKFGKTYEFHTYENAGHAFFAVDRPQYRVHAAVDGWKRVFAWFGKHLH